MPSPQSTAPVYSTDLMGTSKMMAAVLIVAVALINSLLASLAITHLQESRDRVDELALTRTQDLASSLEHGLRILFR